MTITAEEAIIAIEVGKRVVEDTKRLAKQKQKEENYILHRLGKGGRR